MFVKKLIFDFQFVEMKDSYQLICNEEIQSTYLKSKYSRREAESEASDEVNWKIRRYGADRVFYDGNLEN